MMSKQAADLTEYRVHEGRGAPGSAGILPAAPAQRGARLRSEHAKDERIPSPRLTSGVTRARQARCLRSQGFALLCCLLLLAAVHAQDVQPLAPNTLIERELTGTQSHHYRIALKAGQFVHFEVSQKTIDVSLSLDAPNGTHIVQINTSTFSLPDVLSEIATSNGNYQLTINSYTTPTIKGTYKLKAVIKDVATDTDKKRMKAERLMSEYRRVTDSLAQSAIAQEARALWAELGEQAWEDAALWLLGSSQSQLYKSEQSVESLTRLLEASRAANDRAAEADALQRLAIVVGWNQGKHAAALEYLETALPIAREARISRLEILIQMNLAQLTLGMGKVEKALAYAENAIKVTKEVGSAGWEAEATRIALVPIYRTLGQTEKVREALERVRTLYREVGNTDSETSTLLALSYLQTRSGVDPKSLAYLEQILKLLEQRNLTSSSQAIEVFHAIAEYHYFADNLDKAIEFGEKALAISRKFSRHSWEANNLRRLGVYYRKLKQYEKAIDYHERALQLRQEWPEGKNNFSRQDDAIFFVSLMKDWREAGNVEAAIYYGKRGINAFQEARGVLRLASDQNDLQQQLQQSFLTSNEQYYRDLADLLISQARLPEAEQVLRMLKEEEYFEYIRGDSTNTPKGEKATLTPKEEAADKRYREVADKLAALGAERAALLNKPSRTPEEDKRLANIESDLVIAGQAFQKFLDQLSNELKTTKDAGKVSQLREAQGMMEDLRELGNGAVALYTVVGEDTFSLVLTTADVQKAYQVPIKAAELNRKVLAFRAALQNPTLDPLPLAQELYKILLAPVENDLRAANAKLLMWSLDGVLRYVPMAALHDGKQYLVESYRHAVFTPASNARLHFAPNKNWRALGLGVTKAHGEGIPALPGVAEEMRGIIKTDDNAAGVLPGTIKLDEQFTEESMLASLRESNNVIHIASHFKFHPGNETNSALLLGDGQFLSLAQIKTWQNPFRGVELLTLSACNTATSGSANGKEIEGFGVLAQQKGARAVIASLWPVADRSTMRLMQEFYQQRESGLSKAEAMRQAQSKMLRGELAMQATTTTREIVHEIDKTANLPKFKANAQRPFAHPYYWAPFILIGNWK